RVCATASTLSGPGSATFAPLCQKTPGFAPSSPRVHGSLMPCSSCRVGKTMSSALMFSWPIVSTGPPRLSGSRSVPVVKGLGSQTGAGEAGAGRFSVIGSLVVLDLASSVLPPVHPDGRSRADLEEWWEATFVGAVLDRLLDVCRDLEAVGQRLDEVVVAADGVAQPGAHGRGVVLGAAHLAGARQRRLGAVREHDALHAGLEHGVDEPLLFGAPQLLLAVALCLGLLVREARL